MRQYEQLEMSNDTKFASSDSYVDFLCVSVWRYPQEFLTVTILCNTFKIKFNHCMCKTAEKESLSTSALAWQSESWAAELLTPCHVHNTLQAAQRDSQGLMRGQGLTTCANRERRAYCGGFKVCTAVGFRITIKVKIQWWLLLAARMGIYGTALSHCEGKFPFQKLTPAWGFRLNWSIKNFQPLPHLFVHV